MNLGEGAGVAVNSKGHVFVFTRGNVSGPAFGATAAQLLEFGPDGKFLREIGKGLYAFAYAHTVRVDKDDNIWAVDKGSDMIVKFNPEGHVVMVFGRKKEASDEAVPWSRTLNPPLPPVNGMFRQPTDVTWNAQGDIFISDGYVNARVAKYDKNGDWVKSFGEPGKGPGQLNVPHSIASDAAGNIYVADRGNNRIQVFDGDGKVLRQIKINIPAPPGPAADHRQPRGSRRGPHKPGPRHAVGHLHHAGAESGLVRGRRVSGTHLQARSAGTRPGHARQGRTAAEAVWLDSRDGVPIRKRAVCRGSDQLARAEAVAPSGQRRVNRCPVIQ